MPSAAISTSSPPPSQAACSSWSPSASESGGSEPMARFAAQAGDGGVGYYLLGQGDRLGTRTAGRYPAIDQAQAEGLVDTCAPAGEDEVDRGGVPGPPGDELGAPATWDKADRDLRQAEDGSRCRRR